MKSQTFLFAITLVAAALAGCADNDAGSDTDNMPTTTPPASTTPAATPAATPSATPAATPTMTPATPTPQGPPECDAPTAEPAPVGEALGYPELIVTVEEPSGDDECFQFVAPETTTAGWTAVTLRNNGMNPHIMPMFFIGEHTLEEALGAAAAGAPPEWMVAVGGVGFVTPFQSGTVLMDLQEGNYVLICFFGGHHTQGMYRLLTVEGKAENETAAPVANFTISAVDFNFTIEDNITPGTHVVAFVNNGTEDHEFPLVKLNEGTTLQEFLEVVESPNPTGPPPGAGIGGINTIAPGQTGYAIVTFSEGNYGLVCFVESAQHDGAPHIALGMSKEFAVA